MTVLFKVFDFVATKNFLLLLKEFSEFDKFTSPTGILKHFYVDFMRVQF